MTLLPPPVTASLSRRLFRDNLTEGNITIHTGLLPYVTFNIVSPMAFNYTMDRLQPGSATSKTAGSISGFAVGTQYWTYGATLADLNSNLRASIAYAFNELSLQAKLVVELGFGGLALMVTGTWQNESSEISASVGLDLRGVLMKLECGSLIRGS